MAMAARLEGLLLDPVYTGKAMAGLIAHVRSGRIAAGSRVLFLHTGGLPAIFAYADPLEFLPCRMAPPPPVTPLTVGRVPLAAELMAGHGPRVGGAPRRLTSASFSTQSRNARTSGPLPGGPGGDEATPFGRLGLPVEDAEPTLPCSAAPERSASFVR